MFVKLLRYIRKAIKAVNSIRDRGWELFKAHKFIVGGSLLIFYATLLIVLYLIGGWALIIAYLICKLTGACPI